MSITTDFISSIKAQAIANRAAGSCLASVCIAQAICESASGTSGLTQVSNNLFGIKGDYNGAYVDYPTKEWVNGQYVSTTAKFRKYPSMTESIADHMNFLKRIKLASGALRYQAVLDAADYKTATQALKDAGYATSPAYPDTLNKIIETYNLAQYDTTASADAIEVDGVRGPLTIKQWQQVIGTFADGVISKPVSQLIKADQAFLNSAIGAGLKVDGSEGPLTIKARQRYLGVDADGVLGPVTNKAHQAALNRAAIGSGRY